EGEGAAKPHAGAWTLRDEGARAHARRTRLGSLRSRDPETAAAAFAKHRPDDGGYRSCRGSDQAPGACGMTLAAAPAVPNAADAPSRRDAFVELENVTHSYGRGERQVHALDETNLRIDQGDFIALVGPSGCGKSTILKLVTG